MPTNGIKNSLSDETEEREHIVTENLDGKPFEAETTETPQIAETAEEYGERDKEEERAEEVEEKKIMEKTRADVLSEKSKNCYNAIIRIIGEMYDKIEASGKSVSYSREQLFAGFDAYIQAVLVKIASGADKFGADEMIFIENIADYGKLIEGTDLTLFTDCSKEMREKLIEASEDRMSAVPACIKIAAALDSGKDFGLTKAIFENSVRICFNLKLIDEKSDVKNNSDIARALKAITVYAAAKGIKIK
ncbi:MAG TPA: hypothetical protein DDW54_02965 [Clostridiales bacterium]|nr:hypothetical protein [Clostridiales bacterium]